MRKVFSHILSVILFSSFLTASANAGLNIQIGISKGDIVKILLQNGYSQIQVHDKGFKTGKAYACKNGSKYDVKVDIKGNIKGEVKIGSCRNEVGEKQVRRNLEANGFTRVVIDIQNGNYVAIGCKDNQRTRLTISQQGQLLQRRNIGACQEVLEPNDVRQVLRDKGYNRIDFSDRQLPRYIAQACLRGARVELVINRFGEVKGEKRVGRCAPPIAPNTLVSVMNEKGYDRVSVINARPPNYHVEACAKNVRFDIKLDIFGRITQSDRIGACNPVTNEKQITELLRKEGFTRVNVRQGEGGNFNVTACYQGFQKRISLSQYGELLEEVDGKQCVTRSISEIRKTLSDNNVKRPRFYAEGCRNGKKVKIEFNRFGERIGRELLGNC